VAAESAKAVERTRHAVAAAAPVKLQPAMGARLVFIKGENHRRLIAARTKAWRNKRKRRKLHPLAWETHRRRHSWASTPQ